MINIQWEEKDGTLRYDNLLSPLFIGEYIQNLIDRECNDIEIERIERSA